MFPDIATIKVEIIMSISVTCMHGFIRMLVYKYIYYLCCLQ